MFAYSKLTRLSRSSINFVRVAQMTRSFSMKSTKAVRSNSMLKVLSIGSGVTLAGLGLASLAFAQENKDIPVEEKKEESTKSTLEPPPTWPSEEDEDDENDPELKEYNPWFRGVKEISCFLDKESISKLDKEFPQLLPGRHADRVTLVLDPKDEESNSYALFIQENVKIDIIGLIQDKHVNVLMVNLHGVNSVYQYPCIVLDCEGEDDTHAYSEAYGRLLVDRAFKAGMFSMENNHYILKEKEITKVVEDYYTYPETEIHGIDLTDKHITLNSTICTGRGWDKQDCKCNEPKQKAECGWCVFMKGGPCWREFTKWQRCIQACGQNSDTEEFITKCGKPTLILKDCVDANPGYYGEMAQSNEEKQGDDDTNNNDLVIEVDPNEGKSTTNKNTNITSENNETQGNSTDSNSNKTTSEVINHLDNEEYEGSIRNEQI
ncbi:hypothetical protein WA158_003410 [Blastocystis sp. Blastoise]